MDLVDIDQVLDNLEISVAADEKERARVSSLTRTPRASTPTATPTTTSKATTSKTATEIVAVPPETRVSGDGATSRSGTKNFVGVSQVFNSLDDYRNNVKSLETEPTPTYDWKQKDYDDSDEIAEDNTNINNVQTEEETINLSDGFANHHAINDDNDDDDEDDIGDSMDIHKFTESGKAHGGTSSHAAGDNSDAGVSSSDSLTTSSCSTFSSGPSPGNASNSDEVSTLPPSVGFESEQQSELEVMPKALENPMPNENSVDESPNVAMPNDCPVDDSKKSVLEDLATGLSSISITTESQSILPCEVTASSALGKVLNELTETDEVTSQSVQQEFAQSTKGLPISDSEVCVLPPEESGKVEDADFDIQQQHIEGLPKNVSKFMHPITFCSTMDDISDTELDSMLQEIDIDEVVVEQSTNKVATTCVTQKSTRDVKELDTVPTTTVDDSVEVGSEPDTSQSPDHMNADNFSQASTVEFAEIKGGETQSVEPIDKEAEEATSSYSSTDSDSMSGKREDNEQPTTCNAENQEERPARPNTLQLTSCNAQMYSTAGQTPPGVEDNGGTEVMENNGNSQYDLEQEATNEGGDSESISEAVGFSDPHANLGKVPPIWVPDNMAASCMQCQQKFTMIKRRHHCRACGKVLCSVCCSQKIKLEFLPDPESRVCVQCFLILTVRQEMQQSGQSSDGNGPVVTDVNEAQVPNLPPTPMRSPNPNNPMEYCSTIPPHRQVSASTDATPPSVIVPVGVLKKDGSYSSNSSNSSGQKNRKRKSVMFSDGIAPGSELASSMEQQFVDVRQARRVHQSEKARSNIINKPPTPASNETRSIDSTTMGLVAQLFRGSIPPSAAAATMSVVQKANELAAAKGGSKDRTNNSPRRKAESQRSKKLPAGSDPQGSFVPYEVTQLPPICVAKGDKSNCDYEYKEVKNDFDLVERLQKETLKFLIRNNFYVLVKIINLNCCMNRTVINFTTSGMHHVGNDEIIILLEYKPPAKREEFLEPGIPRDIFAHLNEIYCEAEHGRPIAELSYTSPTSGRFLGSRDYGGFIYIRASYQCLQEVILPESPYLVGILIHRHETPWAKVFPLRLVLRLGAQYRYYPCPLISIPNRDSVYAEIAQTIINFLADFRNYSYTLPTIRGMYIHMEDRQTTVLIPRNRQEDVNKAINNASDHILAFAGNFSKTADGHLVCMQNVNDDRTEMYAYSTQAINIQGQPRKVTGASFFVLNEALKSTSGLSGKCSIVEDGLMVQILPSKMEEVRNALRNQTDVNIVCGPIEANDQQTEIVSIKWVDNDRDFNIGVKSPIDEQSMEGISSMRVHASFNYSNANYSIRLTDIYILKFDEWYNATQATLSSSSSDITRISEQIARSASMALIPFLDLLVASGINKLALRATLHQENVCYEAGAKGAKLPPLYMNALDNHLIPTLHNESTGIEDAIVLELIFYILNV